MEPPKWATKLLDRVLEDYDIQGRPDFVWSHRRPGVKSPCDSSGSADEETIRVTAGTSVISQKITLLHEIAHWIIGPSEQHSPRFWDFLWTMCRRYRISPEEVFKTEMFMKEFIKSYFRTRKRAYTP